MEILGIGPLELFFILLIALIVLGPKDMVKAGRTMGRFLHNVITSQTWKAITQTSNELRRLPNRLIREAGLEEELRKLEETSRQANVSLASEQERWQRDISSWTTPPDEADQTILPLGEPAEADRSAAQVPAGNPPEDLKEDPEPEAQD